MRIRLRKGACNVFEVSGGRRQRTRDAGVRQARMHPGEQGGFAAAAQPVQNEMFPTSQSQHHVSFEMSAGQWHRIGQLRVNVGNADIVTVSGNLAWRPRNAGRCLQAG